MNFNGQEYGVPRIETENALRSKTIVGLLDYPGEYPHLTVATTLAKIKVLLVAQPERELRERLTQTSREDQVNSAVDEYRECLVDIDKDDIGKFGWHVLTIVTVMETLERTVELLKKPAL